MSFYKEHNINPAASCLPMVFQIPVFISLYFVLKHFANNPPGGNLEWLGAGQHHRPRLRRLGQAAARHLRGQPDVVDLLHGDDDGQDAAEPDDGAAARLRRLHHQLPDRPADLLGDDEPLDGRPGPDHAPARPEDARAVARSRARSRRPSDGGNGAKREPPKPKPAPAAAPQQRQVRRRKKGRPPVSPDDPLSVEVTGETVGEAKWLALRELERIAPGLDKAAVRFQVRLRGRARPARRRLRAGPRRRDAPTRSAGARGSRATRAPPPRTPGPCSSGSSARSAFACRIEVDETDDEIRVTCEGPDLGLLIGRHGQTIDSVQYLANAIVWKGAERPQARRRRRGRLPRPPRGDAAARRRPRRGARASRTASRSSSSRCRRRAQRRARAAEGLPGRHDLLRRRRAEPVCRRPPCLTAGSKRSSRHPA